MTNDNATKAPPPNAALAEMERRRDEAAARFPVIPAEMHLQMAVVQLAYRIAPTAIPLVVLNTWFDKAGARNRDTLSDFLFAQSKRFGEQEGQFASILTNRERFFREVEPELAKKGCGVEAWVKTLRAAGSWAGP